jgi:arabinose-5-phosphate isomerase
MIPKDATGSALELASRVLAIEADAVRALIAKPDERFLAAVSLIRDCKGRVIVSGDGDDVLERQGQAALSRYLA